MSKVGVTLGASHLYAGHAEGFVLEFGDVLVGERPEKTRPAAPRIILVLRSKQRGVATDAAVGPAALLVPKAAGEGALRAALPCDGELTGSQFGRPGVLVFRAGSVIVFHAGSVAAAPARLSGRGSEAYKWGGLWESNPRPPGPQPGALTN